MDLWVFVFARVPDDAGVPWGSILGLAVFLLYTNKFSDDVISNAVIYGDGTTLYFVTITRVGFLT